MMTGPSGERRARPRSSLLPKILATLLLVLLLSSGATLAFETRLTRATLQAQARALLGNDLDVLRADYVDRQSDLVIGVRQAAQRMAFHDAAVPSQRTTLIAELGRLRRDLRFDVVGAVARSGEMVYTDGVAVDLPEPGQFADLVQTAPSHLLRTSDGRYAQMAIVPAGARPDSLLLFGGRLFDDAAAYRMRRLVGHDVLLVADGRLVGSTLRAAPTTPPLLASGRLPEQPGVVDLDGVETFVGYLPVSTAAGTWAADGWIGVALPDPVARLRRSLTESRLLGFGVLLVLASGLGWLLFRLLARPLLQLSATAQRIAEGDLDASFQPRTHDEIGTLAHSLERMRRALRRQLGLIQQQGAALQETSARIVTAQDRERRRLAADLHDDLQQQLIMLRVRIGLARELLATDPAAAGELADELSRDVDRAIKSLREVSQNIFPSILQDRGLGGALYSLAGRCPLPTSVAVEPDPLPRFDPHVEANAYFLVSEAVTNALKHAGASSITIDARLEGKRLHVHVSDDGSGLRPDAPQPGGPIGDLGHLRDRATALGGTVVVGRGPDGRGTSMRASLPVDCAARPSPAEPSVALQEEQDRGDAPVQVDLVAQPELVEDRVDVLLDRPLGDE